MQHAESDPVRIRRIEAIGKLNNLNPVWIELKAMLEEEIEWATEEVITIETKTDEVLMWRGYLKATRNVLKALEDYRNSNHTISDSDAEA